MADASTFGGQVDGGTQFGADFGGGNDATMGPGTGADVTPVPSVPSPAPSAAPTFGSGFSPPKYTSDPGLSPLDQSADLLQQRINRANQISSNPMAQFFNPEGVQA